MRKYKLYFFTLDSCRHRLCRVHIPHLGKRVFFQRFLIHMVAARLHTTHLGGGSVEYAMVAERRNASAAWGVCAAAAACVVPLWRAAAGAIVATTAERAADAPPAPLLWLCALVGGCAALWAAQQFCCSSSVRKESITLLDGLGVQLQRETFGGRTTTRFLAAERVASLVLNEGVSVWNVAFYLAVAVTGESDLYIVFQDLNPPLAVLRTVYSDLSGRIAND